MIYKHGVSRKVFHLVNHFNDSRVHTPLTYVNLSTWIRRFQLNGKLGLCLIKLNNFIKVLYITFEKIFIIVHDKKNLNLKMLEKR